MKTLVKVSIPSRLRDEMLLKQAEYFEVPHTPAGFEFMSWWEKAASDDRDVVMKYAYDSGSDIVDALKKLLSKTREGASDVGSGIKNKLSDAWEFLKKDPLY